MNKTIIPLVDKICYNFLVNIKCDAYNYITGKCMIEVNYIRDKIEPSIDEIIDFLIIEKEQVFIN